MHLKFWAASLCVVVIATMAAAPASAETKKKRVEYGQSETAKRPRARITVEPRSFLDGGRELPVGERKFTDYAFPPGYSPLAEALGPFRDYRRQPLLDPWDFPGTSKGW
jgi:hypothetical protein